MRGFLELFWGVSSRVQVLNDGKHVGQSQFMWKPAEECQTTEKSVHSRGSVDSDKGEMSDQGIPKS